MTTNELYALSAKNGIRVHSVRCPKSKAIALEIEESRFIGIDRSVFKSEYEERLILAHELGHSLTNGYYSALDNPVNVKRMEHRALKKTVELLIPEDELRTLLSEETNVYELSEHFSVPEDLIKKAIWFYYRKEIS